MSDNRMSDFERLSENEDIPEMNSPNRRFPVLESDKFINAVDNGVKTVRPVPPPDSEIIERVRKRYKSKSKIEQLLTLGYNP